MKRVPFCLCLLLVSAAATLAQRNNPFSVNPDVRTTVASAKQPEPRQADIPQIVKARESQPTVTSIDPTRTYKIGVGDTLEIVLANAPNASGYYSVRADGTIDFPLAGDSPSVRGMTTTSVEQMLSSRIKLYRDARVTAKVREFGSHKINVSGLVERNGERFLQREAMPLFTIKADAGIKADATRVVIRRSTGSTETYSLIDIKTDDVLVRAGDAVEFVK